MNRQHRQYRRNKLRIRRKPINFVASLFTTLTMYAGIASIFAAIKGEPEEAAYWIIAAMFFDTLDGAIARVTKSVSEFGKQLDSICDVVAFGVAPAVILFTVYVSAENQPYLSKVGEVVAIIYAICGALRLARYNVYHSDVRDYFRGLPIPAAAATVASFVLFNRYLELTIPYWVTPMVLVLSYLMVSTLRYPKERLKNIVLAPKSAFPMLVLAGVGIAILHNARDYHPAIALFPLAAAYVSYGIVDYVYMRLHVREAPVLNPNAEAAPPTPRPADPRP